LPTPGFPSLIVASHGVSQRNDEVANGGGVREVGDPGKAFGFEGGDGPFNTFFATAAPTSVIDSFLEESLGYSRSQWRASLGAGASLTSW
jgi:hypothetical protein